MQSNEEILVYLRDIFDELRAMRESVANIWQRMAYLEQLAEGGETRLQVARKELDEQWKTMHRPAKRLDDADMRKIERLLLKPETDTKHEHK